MAYAILFFVENFVIIFPFEFERSKKTSFTIKPTIVKHLPKNDKSFIFPVREIRKWVWKYIGNK